MKTTTRTNGIPFALRYDLFKSGVHISKLEENTFVKLKTAKDSAFLFPATRRKGLYDKTEEEFTPPGNPSEYKKFLQEQKEKLSIQRFKGLGEMNPEELWETTLNPENRTMLRVQYTKGTKDKSKEDQKMIEVLMGDEVAPRKDFITNNALEVTNLDI